MAYFSQLLALFLILLCFFIMLVALSKQRLPTVGAGGARPDGFQAGPTIAGDGSTALIADLRQRVVPHTGEVLVTGLGNGPNLNVVLPVERLFERNSARLAASSADLIEALAASLAQEADGRALELEAVFAVPSTASQPIIAERAGTLARELVRMGGPARRIAVGFEAGAADRIRLSFYSRGLVPAVALHAAEARP